jgi:hypothetical protein
MFLCILLGKENTCLLSGIIPKVFSLKYQENGIVFRAWSQL